MVRGIANLITRISEQWSIPLARVALFVIYFWFGILKLFAVSPANPLVASLLERTLPFLTFSQFILFLGVYEMLIGLAFLMPGWERRAFLLIIPHMLMAWAPLFLLSQITWSGFMTPTLEGQYILKNVLIISLAISLIKMTGRKQS